MKNMEGYSLLEIFIVLALVAGGFTLAIPSYHWLIQKTEMEVNVQHFMSLLNYARQEAILRHQVVSLCPSRDAKECGGLWEEGMLIFADPENVGQIKIGSSQLLKVLGPLPSHHYLIWNRANNLIQIAPTGNLLKSQNGTFTYCFGWPKAYTQYAIILSLSGRVRVLRREHKPC